MVRMRDGLVPSASDNGGMPAVTEINKHRVTSLNSNILKTRNINVSQFEQYQVHNATLPQEFNFHIGSLISLCRRRTRQ